MKTAMYGMNSIGLAAVLGASLLAGGAAAQSHKLNPTLPRPAAGDIRRFLVNSAGDRVVFLADQNVDEIFELFVARPSGGRLVVTRLNAPLVTGGDVADDFVIAPGDHRVVYRADQDRNDTFELYSVAIDGGTPVKLSGPLVSGGSVRVPSGAAFSVSPDGTRVLYIADEDTNDVFELFSAPIDGSAPPQKISGPLVFGGDVQSASFTPDGQRALYLANQEAATKIELYSAVFDGSRAPVRLSSLATTNSAVTQFQVSADSTRAVYKADQKRDEQFELFSAPIDGGAIAELSGLTDRAGRDVMLFTLAGDRAVYRADEDTQDVFEVYSAPIDGSSASVRLNAALVAGEGVIDFAAAPDGSRVAFMASSGALSSYDLFTVLADGSAPAVRVNPPLLPFATVFGGFQFTPDSTRLVYEAEQDSATTLELYVAPADASLPAQKLNPPLVSGGNVSYGFAFVGTQGVVFKADALTDNVIELFGAPLAGGPAVKLSGSLVAGGNVGTGTFTVPDEAYKISANGRRVFYLADEDVDDVFELFGVPASGAHPAVKLNLGLPVGPIEGDVLQYEPSADGAWAVYLADQRENDLFELFRVSAFGAQRFTRLSSDLAPRGDVTFFELSPDGTRAVYRADQDQDEVYELFSVLLDGSLAPVRLNSAPVAGGDVTTDFVLTPDGTRVLYVADQDQDGVDELYSVPVDGSAPPVKLSGALVAGGGVVGGLSSRPTALLVSPDSSRVVYVADAQTVDVYELFSVPVDGSAPPVKLNGPLQPSGDILYYLPPSISARISPDGARVLFLADAFVNYEYELFSAPIDGSSPAVKLSGTPLGRTVVGLPAFTSDGLRAIFRASEIAPGGSELYVVPSDGSTAALLLTPGLGATVQVEEDYRIGAGDTLAVFRADANTAGAPELYSVPLNASAAPLRLNGPLAPNGAVHSEFPGEPVFRLSPDGLRAAYTANQFNQNLDLYSVPIDGSAPSTSLTVPSPSFHAVSSDFRYTPDGTTVLFVQDPHLLLRVPATGGQVPRRLDAPGVNGVLDFAQTRTGDRVVFRGGLLSGVYELYVSFLASPRRPAGPLSGTITRTVVH